MEYLKVKNWEEFQHYKDRNPPWIKLHRDLLNHYEFTCLQDASKLHLMLIWLLASQLDNKIPADAEWIQHRLHLEETPDLKSLIEIGFLIGDSDSLAESKQSAILEAEAEAEKKPRSRNKKYSDDDMKVAKEIYQGVLRLNPSARKPNFETWADDIRKTRELDKRSLADIRRTFLWANNDAFWQANILSPDKLRRQYDTLTMRMKAQKGEIEQPAGEIHNAI